MNLNFDGQNTKRMTNSIVKKMLQTVSTSLIPLWSPTAAFMDLISGKVLTQKVAIDKLMKKHERYDTTERQRQTEREREREREREF